MAGLDDGLDPEADPEAEVNIAVDAAIDTAGNNPPPLHGPLLVSLTGYRLLNMSVVIAFGTTKAVLTAQGKSAAPNALDWVLGVLFTVGSYWIGLWEAVRPPVYIWFFHTDYTRDIIFFSRRFVTSFCVIFACGIIIPILSLLITFLPIWFIFNPAATGLEGETVIWRLYGVIGTWFIVNFVFLGISEDYPLIWIPSLILRLAYHAIPQPRPLFTSIGRWLDKIIIKAWNDSDILSSDPPLPVTADMMALTSVIGLLVFTLERLRQQWDDFGGMEYSAGTAMILFGVMTAQSEKMQFGNLTVGFSFIYHFIYVAYNAIHES